MGDSSPGSVLLSPVTFTIRALGRVLAAVLGLALMAVGVALTMTVIGAIAGVPMFVFGLLLAIRSVF
jgi:hypothetical protein